MPRRHTRFILPLLALLCARSSQAHFALLQPPSALAIEDGGKGAPPCAEGPDSNIVTAVQGGHPLAIRLSEFVFHPGHYRFALSVNSRTELPADPDVVAVDGVSVSAPVQNPARIPVLADGVFQHTAPPDGDWQTTIVLPNLSCDKCTLQIIEFMAEHGFNPGGGYFYHHCADLRITADANLPPADPAWPRATAQSRAAFAHIAAGGPWTTSITLINLSAAPVSLTLAFHGDDGSASTLFATVTNQGASRAVLASSVSEVLQPDASLLIVAGDPLAPTQTGWADVLGSAPLGGYAIFGAASGSGPPSEGSVPLQNQLPPAITFAYDNTAGYVTSVGIANPSSGAANITATMWDDSGHQLGTHTIALPAGGHSAFELPGRLPLTAGQRGIVRFQSSAPEGIAGLGLRFSPSGTFTSIPAM
jgi:hypothetical protein